MRRKLILTLCLLSLFLSLTGYAAPEDTANDAEISEIKPASSSTKFSPKEANQTLSKISLKQLLEKADIPDLQNTLALINKMTIKAKKCISDNTLELQKLSKITPTPTTLTTLTTEGTEASNTPSVDQKYLDRKKQEVGDQIAQCRLFMLRADEMTEELSYKLRELLKSQLMYANTNSLENFKTLPNDLESFTQAFDTDLLFDHSGLGFFDQTKILILISLLLFSIVLSLWLKHIFSRLIGQEPKKEFFNQICQTFLSTLKKYLTPLLLMLTFVLFMIILERKSNIKTSYLMLLGYGALTYVGFLALVRFIFYPPKPAVAVLTHMPKELAKSLSRRLTSLATICLIAFFVYVIFNEQSAHGSLEYLAQTLFITLISINLLFVVWLVQKLPRLATGMRVLRFLISLFTILFLCVILATEWLGYHQLAYYLLHDVTITVVAITVARLLHLLIKTSFGGYSDTVTQFQQKLKPYLGLKPQQRVIELLCLRLIMYFVIWAAFLLFLMKTWGLGQTGFQHVLSGLLNGFRLANFDIVPSRIILGILFFIFLTIATRFIKTYVIKHSNQHLTLGNRESLGAILGYIGFAIAILIGLLAAGVNFSGLAIIAGALSVGIGFGLQNIVNNFVSGIILLIERPIKPGDRIIVGDTEGHVRRVSIRSTHIVTTQHSDVIVPNSDLISKQVTNYMLFDTNFFVVIDLGLAYGSDTELAKKLLLEIAHAHPQVITDRIGFEPTVYFKEFGESALNFSLWCLVNDVNLKGHIKSALNFEIDRIFRENNIAMAFPQRDITIRNWPNKNNSPLEAESLIPNVNEGRSGGGKTRSRKTKS